MFAVERAHLAEVRSFWESLGVRFEEFTRDDYGLQILFAWDHGVEIVSCVEAGGAFVPAVEEHLAVHGEGIYKVNYGVADLDEMLQRLKGHGLRGRRMPQPTTGAEPWLPRFHSMVPAWAEPVAGIDLMYLEVDPVDPTPVHGRISHVTFDIDPADIVRARWLLSTVLELDDVVVSTESDVGGSVSSWAAGIEVIATGDAGAHAVTFRVGDLQEAIGRIRSAGLIVADVSETSPTSAGSVKLRRAVLQPVHGVRVTLMEVCDEQHR
jgi:hypothetical protein